MSEQQEHVFEQRAENLSAHELDLWTAPFPDDSTILAKLCGPGAKLLSGPRGSGKSTYLRRAYFALASNGPSFPVYVNYSKSLALEPIFHTHASAALAFRQWILLKIVDGISSSAKEINGTITSLPSDFIEWTQLAKERLNQLQVGQVPDFDGKLLSPTQLIEMTVAVAETFGRARVILLLDDAAHAFSSEQQREFFEIFRELRTREISPKAAVYPGITSYSANFHVGHEAELVEMWYRSDAPDYIHNMRAIIERRLPQKLGQLLLEKDDLLTLIAYAAFGMPRALLNMASSILGVEENPRIPTRQLALEAIAEHATSVHNIFSSLKKKLPRFKQYVEIGTGILGSITETLKDFNGTKDIDAKVTIVAIEEPIDSKFERILNFFEYSGMLRRVGSLSKGEKGFQRFRVHFASVVSSGALAMGRNFSVSDLNICLSNANITDIVRRKPSVLLGRDFDKRCTLELPECSKCHEPRVMEEQRFCMKCGNELTSVSLYRELLQAPIEMLDLPPSKIEGIRQYCGFRTVQEILTDDTGKLRDVPYVGEIWQRRIRTCAEEFVGV